MTWIKKKKITDIYSPLFLKALKKKSKATSVRKQAGCFCPPIAPLKL